MSQNRCSHLSFTRARGSSSAPARSPGSATLAAELGRRALLVADPGIVAAGYAARVTELLEAAGVGVVPFHDFGENPDSAMVARGRDVAAPHAIDVIVAVGGGSSLDCAKGINFLLTNGGTVADYGATARRRKPMLPMLAVPTTAGTGSEAQSYAVLSDAETHVKMACGAPGAAFRVALLDPELTVTAPPERHGRGRHRRHLARGRDVGHDAAHAALRRVRARRVAAAEQRLRARPDDAGRHRGAGRDAAGAFYAGLAIEQSMLGATHACANPLTQRYGTTHGVAISLLLPHVVRWNSRVVADRYAELAGVRGESATPRDAGRADRGLHRGRRVSRRPRRGRCAGARPAGPGDRCRAAVDRDVQSARKFDVAGALEIYAAAY